MNNRVLRATKRTQVIRQLEGWADQDEDPNTLAAQSYIPLAVVCGW